MTIRWRLTLSFAALLFVTLCICSVSIYMLLVYELQREAQQTTEALVVQAQRLAAAGGDGDREGIGMSLAEPSLADTVARGDRYLEVRDPAWRAIGRSASLRGLSLVSARDAALGAPGFSRIETVPGIGPVMVVASPVFDQGTFKGTIVAGRSLAEFDRTAARLRDILILVSIGALGVAVIGGWWLAGMALRPVDRITRAAQSIRAGDLSERLSLAGPNDELHRLASAFNDMLGRLHHEFERERRFTADAAHELRTPLTILQGEIDVTLRKPRSADEYRTGLLALRSGVARLGRLVADLLLLARVDAGAVSLPIAEVDLCSLLVEVADRFTQTAEAQGVGIRLEGPDHVLIPANRAGLDRAVTNLIENALHHSKEGSAIELRWTLAEPEAIIEVSDAGSGIAPEHLAHVFRRFYRADHHRSRSDGGNGLGLAITKTIVDVHGGTIVVESQPHTRTTFTVRLPAVREAM